MSPRILMFALFALIASGSPVTAQVTVSVPKDYPTIQDALDDISDGTTVVISKGTYTEAVRVRNLTDVTLRGKGKVLIVPPNVSTIPLRVEDCGTVRLEKLRFDGGFYNVEIDDSIDVTVKRCRFGGDTNAGIDASSCGSVRIELCRFATLNDAAQCRLIDDIAFVKNRVQLDGGDTGISVQDSGAVLVERCRFTGEDDGTGISLGEASLPNAPRLLSRNRFKDVECGISDESKAVTIERNRVRGAEVGFEIGTEAGAIVERNRVTQAEVGFSDFSNGSTYDRNVSKGALEYGFDVTGQNNTFTKNRATKSGIADLRDTSGGQNTYADDNTFKVTILE